MSKQAERLDNLPEITQPVSGEFEDEGVAVINYFIY